MGIFEHFPYTNFHDLNLDWIVQLIRTLDSSVEDIDTWVEEHKKDYAELARKVQGLIDHLVDAILPWDSSREYLIYSIVSWEGSNYIAIQDVPVGVMITNTDYWVESNTLTAQLNAISQVTSEIRKENIRHFNSVGSMLIEESLSDGAYARTAGYYYVQDGGGALYKIDSTAGTTPETLALTNGLYAHIVPDDPEICYVDQLGAVGNGTADDTAIINHCLETYRVTMLGCNKTYLISNTLTVPYGHSIDGQNAMILTVPAADFTDHGVTGLPTKIAMFVQGREPVAGTELQGYTRYVKGFRLVEGGTLNDLTGSADFVGIYIGYRTPLSGTGSKVNNAVSAYLFENIYIHGFDYAINAAEMWECKFINLAIRNFKSRGLMIAGQCVNIYWTECSIDGRNVAGTVGVQLNVSPNYANRPEGNMFTNVGIFSCEDNFLQTSALSTQLSNCMVDLAVQHALSVYVGDLMATNCWFSSKTGVNDLAQAMTSPTVRLNNIGAANAGNKVTLINCHLINTNLNNGTAPVALASGFNRFADVVSFCHSDGSMRQTNSLGALFLYNNSLTNSSDTVYTVGNGKRSGNYLSVDGTEVN